MKRSKKTYEIPLYYGELVVIQDSNRERVAKKYNIKEDMSTFSACMFSSPTKDGYTRYVMSFFGKTEPSVIAHEAVHAVNSIFVDRYIKLDPLNDEPQAYLLGWIVSRCHKTLKLK